MATPVFAVQYLETLPTGITSIAASRRLCEAFKHLPISMVLLGWELPPKFEETVAEETVRQGAQLYRWLPWLTGDARTDLPSEWAVVGSDGAPISGHNDKPAVTFVCPNRSGVADFLMERLEGIAARGLFTGVFLDRIRFPSPLDNPSARLGCFCRHCTRLAADGNLDLEPVRRFLQSAPSDKESARLLVRGLFGQFNSPGSSLEAFLDFRAHSITRTIDAANSQADSSGLSLALDCFSPTLTHMVGQDLQSLESVCDWIKLMIYPRVFAPAGLPFELLGLATWLIRAGWKEFEAKDILAEATGLTLPENLTALRHAGFESGIIAHEIEHGRTLAVINLLAGIPLIQMKIVHESTPEQILADINAARAADGLVISWDLWHTPLEYLDTIRTSWEL